MRIFHFYLFLIPQQGLCGVIDLGPTTTFDQKTTTFCICFHLIQTPQKRLKTQKQLLIGLFSGVHTRSTYLVIDATNKVRAYLLLI